MRGLATQLVRLLPSSIDVRTDGDLLALFLTDGIEADFAELVRRHGPLVWGACRRSLPNTADAEDAFQATFLVLVRRGRKLTNYSTIGPWLYRVAVWTARNLRRRNASRLTKQTALSDRVPAPSSNLDLPLDIDAALLALPEKFRSPIVLCHLLGFSRADAAERLGCPEGTLSSWLSRGLAKLRANFGGLDPAKPLGVAAVAVPIVLASSAVRAAVASRAVVAASAAISSTVSQVVEGVMRMFWIKKATAMTATVFAVFAFGVGIGLTGRQVEGVAGGQEKSTVRMPENADPQAAADLGRQISHLEENLAVAQIINRELQRLAEDLDASNEALRRAGADPTTIKERLAQAERTHNDADKAAAEVKTLKDKLAKLKALKQTPFDPIQKPKEVDRSAILKEVNEIAAKIGELNKRAAELSAEVMKYEDEFHAATRAAQKAASKRDDILEALKAYENQVAGQRAELKAKQADLAKQPADTKAGAFVEVTLRGEATKFDFVIRETDENGKVFGSATVSTPEMLVKLLARTKNDATAPKELRLIAEPPTALGGGPAFLFKACDSAGYTKVKYTGYVIGGGFTPALKPGQRGDAPGYRWYDNAERTPASLLEEHAKGMVTF